MHVEAPGSRGASFCVCRAGKCLVAPVLEVDAKSPGRAALLIEVGSKEPCCSLRFWVRWEANSRGGGAAALEFWARGGKGARRGVAALVFLGEVGCKKARVCCSPVMPSQVDQAVMQPQNLG